MSFTQFGLSLPSTSNKETMESSYGSTTSWNELVSLSGDDVLDLLPMPCNEPVVPNMPTNNPPMPTTPVTLNNPPAPTAPVPTAPVPIPPMPTEQVPTNDTQMPVNSVHSAQYFANNSNIIPVYPPNQPNVPCLRHIANGFNPAMPDQQAQSCYVSLTPTWTTNKKSGYVKKPKRNRTAFTTQQIIILEKEYKRKNYLDGARRLELADVLRLKERTIKIWFQNRRMKEKKDLLASLKECEGANITQSSPDTNNVETPMLIHEQYPSTGSMGMEYMTTTSNYVQVPAVKTPETLHQGPLRAHTYPVSGNIYNGVQWQQSQQGNVPVQQYPPTYNNEVYKLPSQAVPQNETVSTINSSNENSDLSWASLIDGLKLI